MAFKIPICASPFAPPPLSVRPILGRVLRCSGVWAKASEISEQIEQPVIKKIQPMPRKDSMRVIIEKVYG
jgi:hypothetical protein